MSVATINPKYYDNDIDTDRLTKALGFVAERAGIDEERYLAMIPSIINHWRGTQ